jgi:single-stranded DNA-binding protein
MNKDGVKHYTTDIIADNMQMLGNRIDSEPGESSRSAGINEDNVPS